MVKVLFVIPEYSFGGTNKSLENLLSLIDHEKYKIFVYSLYEDGGDYYKKAFSPYILKKSRLYYWLHDNVWTRKVMGLINKLTHRDQFTFLYKYEANYLQKKYQFDVVAAYQEGKTTEFVSYFKETKRIAWVQCDYPQLVGTVRYEADKAYYQSYQQIVCVSEYTAKSMFQFFSLDQSKVVGIHNTVNVEQIKELAHEYSPAFDSCIFNIVSVGRLHEEKLFDKIPEIVSKINVKRPFRWYILGSGPDEGLIKNEIDKYHLQNKIFLTGMVDNPYPYIKNANLVVMTSRTESFSYVIAEAKILHTPVVSTDFPVAYEVLDESCGWISSLSDMPSLLTSILNDEHRIYEQKKKSVSDYQYSNRRMIEAINQVLRTA